MTRSQTASFCSLRTICISCALKYKRRTLFRMDNTTVLNPDIADLFSLEPQADPADELPRNADSADCTNNGCTNTCRGC